MKNMPEDIFLIEKKAEDNFVGALCSVKFLEEYEVKVEVALEVKKLLKLLKKSRWFSI